MTDDSNCHDCGATPGTPHVGGCDTARCLWTGGQRLACDGGFADIVRQLRADGHPEMAERLAYHLSIEDEAHDCGDDVWTGEWPGDAVARRLGLWCYWGPDYGGKGWVRCEPDHPGAQPDLNRLHTGARWDREAKRWELPSRSLS